MSKQHQMQVAENSLQPNDVALEKDVQVTTPVSKVGHLKTALLAIFKWACYIAVFIGLSKFFSLLSTVHGKEIPAEYFRDGYPSILGLMNSEFFMGLIFMITLTVVGYVIYLLWELHEVAVHKAQKMASQHIQVVFALSLCGLFIDKMWWVLAIVIAFTRWDLIAAQISKIIHVGVHGQDNKVNSEGDK